MEESERDVINNRITQETINRQKNILTELLRAENSDRERGEDNEKVSKEWDLKRGNNDLEFIKYQRQKKAYDELLKTTPVKLTPFYKKKVTSYFNNFIND